MVIRGGSGASYLSTAGDITAMIFKSTLFFLLPLLWAANAPEQSSVTESKTLGAGHYARGQRAACFCAVRTPSAVPYNFLLDDMELGSQLDSETNSSLSPAPFSGRFQLPGL